MERLNQRQFQQYGLLAILLAGSLSCNHILNTPQHKFKVFELFQDSLSISGNYPLHGPLMKVLPAGKFLMGPAESDPIKLDSEQPPHFVTIKQPFAISPYEITFEQYDLFVKATGYRHPSDKGWGTKFWGRGKTPVFNVNWYDAKEYTRWLSHQTGAKYRLPTEAEWEYSARAGSSLPFTTGRCISTDQANFHGRKPFGDCPIPTDYRGKVLEIGSFPANAWGLYDVHGNVFEWTEDCWHENYVEAPDDGRAWIESDARANCNRRVLRGGSWSSFVNDIRLSNRANNDMNIKSIFIGFRVVRELYD